jgi:hypothetical protein
MFTLVAEASHSGMIYGRFAEPVDRFAVPAHGLYNVFGQAAAAIFVHVAKTAHSWSMSGLGRSAEPSHGLCLIFGKTSAAFCIHAAKVVEAGLAVRPWPRQAKEGRSRGRRRGHRGCKGQKGKRCRRICALRREVRCASGEASLLSPQVIRCDEIERPMISAVLRV